MADICFETKGLSVGYDGKPLIRGLSIRIRRGEILSLIGPNGAGKSTILKSITRQLKTHAGTVLIEKEELTRLPWRELATRMSVLLTERPHPEWMTARDVAAMGRYPYTGRFGILTSEDERKVTQALEAVKALEFADRNFRALSDGQRQRVLVARALCQEPRILVLDEPTSFLDIHHKLELLALLRELARKQKLTVIMSLHEIDLAQKISDRILCVKGDIVDRCGTPEEIFQAETIRDLYEIGNGYYDPLFGNLELPKPVGEPDVLVLSSCGTGIPVYRSLQRKGIPFCAGILYTNDADYHLARLRATEIFAERPFFEISDGVFARTIECVRRIRRVVDAGVKIGTSNWRMQELLGEAARLGKLERRGAL